MVRFLVVTVSFVLALTLGNSAEAKDGHCTYRQLAPSLRQKYQVCRMPATPETCDRIVSRYHSWVEFAEGSCPTGAVGTCDIGGERVFFYAGDAETLAKGCGYMQGTWLGKVQPQPTGR